MDGETERGSVLLERTEQIRVAVAGDRLAGWIERYWINSGERLCLGDVEHGCEPEADELQLGLLVVRLLVVRASVADGSEDPDRLLALAYAAPEFEPLAEPGDMGCVRALERDQERVAERVAVEARACAKPALPAFAGEQGVGCTAEAVGW